MSFFPHPLGTDVDFGCGVTGERLAAAGLLLVSPLLWLVRLGYALLSALGILGPPRAPASASAAKKHQ